MQHIEINVANNLDETLIAYLALIAQKGGAATYDVDDEVPLGAPIAEATETVLASKVGSWGMNSN